MLCTDDRYIHIALNMILAEIISRDRQTTTPFASFPPIMQHSDSEIYRMRILAIQSYPSTLRLLSFPPTTQTFSFSAPPPGELVAGRRIRQPALLRFGELSTEAGACLDAMRPVDLTLSPVLGEWAGEGVRG